LNNTLQLGVGAAERVLDMMNLNPRIANTPKSITENFSKPDIMFDKVVFRYEGQESNALSSLSFTAKSGNVTALVGASGSGKSTILNLLLRFYEPESGDIKIDSTSIKDLTLESLRGAMALVSQDITIFDDTVASNIGYGNKNATLQDIIEAAKAAAAYDFIEAMPQGFHTIVGEQGVRLSGGQRQRLALARAIVRKAPILLLDEATSALDNESERLIQDSLERLQKDKTTLVIAHRLSTIQSADHIIVLDKGMIVEEGTHEFLIALNGFYTRMHSAVLNS
jgi:subfamily B ATP-binding cassette protein MsbA